MSDDYNEMPPPWLGYGDRVSNGTAQDAFYKRLADKSPEARLCAALLSDAADALTLNPNTKHKRLVIKDAQNWFFVDDFGIVSLAQVCAMLGFEIEYIRRLIRTRPVVIKQYQKNDPYWQRKKRGPYKQSEYSLSGVPRGKVVNGDT